jgi:hypothetical protein
MKKNLANFFLHPRQIKISTISEKICRNFFIKKSMKKNLANFFHHPRQIKVPTISEKMLQELYSLKNL